MHVSIDVTPARSFLLCLPAGLRLRGRRLAASILRGGDVPGRRRVCAVRLLARVRVNNQPVSGLCAHQCHVRGLRLRVLLHRAVSSARSVPRGVLLPRRVINAHRMWLPRGVSRKFHRRVIARGLWVCRLRRGFVLRRRLVTARRVCLQRGLLRHDAGRARPIGLRLRAVHTWVLLCGRRLAPRALCLRCWHSVDEHVC